MYSHTYFTSDQTTDCLAITLNTHLHSLHTDHRPYHSLSCMKIGANTERARHSEVHTHTHTHTHTHCIHIAHHPLCVYIFKVTAVVIIVVVGHSSPLNAYMHTHDAHTHIQ